MKLEHLRACPSPHDQLLKEIQQGRRDLDQGQLPLLPICAPDLEIDVTSLEIQFRKGKRAAAPPRRRSRLEAEMTQKHNRDIEKDYPLPEFIEKLRRLADALEQGKPFKIQIAGKRISVPARAIYNIEHERGDDEEEIEFQIKWSKK